MINNSFIEIYNEDCLVGMDRIKNKSIKTYTEENDTVLDSCMGSGSTMIACKSTKRNGIGFEIDKDIFEVAKNRIKKFNFLF